MDRSKKKDDKQSLYDVYRACRLCGAGGGYKMPIIQNFLQIDGEEIDLKQKIRECLQLEINADDRMPPLICELCVDKVNDFYEFLNVCRQTNKQTRLRLGLPLKITSKESATETCMLGLVEASALKVEPDEPPLKKTLTSTRKQIKPEPLKQAKDIKNLEKSKSKANIAQLETPTKLAKEIKSLEKSNPFKDKSLKDIKIDKEKEVLEKDKGKKETPKRTTRNSLEDLVMTRVQELPKRPTQKAGPKSMLRELKELIAKPEDEPTKLKRLRENDAKELPPPPKKTKPEPKPEKTLPKPEKTLPKPTPTKPILKPNLLKNVQTSNIQDKFPCPACNNALKNKGAFATHIMKCHPVTFTSDNLACNACREWFPTIEESISHHKKHTHYKCLKCKKKYKNGVLYHQHIENKKCIPEIEVPDEKCIACWRLFATKNLLNQHRCLGVDGRPGGKCSKCNRNYTLLKNLKKHESTCTFLQFRKSVEPVIDPKVKRSLLPMEVRISRCDDLLQYGPIVSACTVPHRYGLDPRKSYPYMPKLRVIKPSYVSTPEQSQTEFGPADLEWEDFLTTTKDDTVKNLSTLSLKVIFSEKMLGHKLVLDKEAYQKRLSLKRKIDSIIFKLEDSNSCDSNSILDKNAVTNFENLIGGLKDDEKSDSTVFDDVASGFRSKDDVSNEDVSFDDLRVDNSDLFEDNRARNDETDHQNDEVDSNQISFGNNDENETQNDLSDSKNDDFVSKENLSKDDEKDYQNDGVSSNEINLVNNDETEPQNDRSKSKNDELVSNTDETDSQNDNVASIDINFVKNDDTEPRNIRSDSKNDDTDSQNDDFAPKEDETDRQNDNVALNDINVVSNNDNEPQNDRPDSKNDDVASNEINFVNSDKTEPQNDRSKSKNDELTSKTDETNENMASIDINFVKNDDTEPRNVRSDSNNDDTDSQNDDFAPKEDETDTQHYNVALNDINVVNKNDNGPRKDRHDSKNDDFGSKNDKTDSQNDDVASNDINFANNNYTDLQSDLVSKENDAVDHGYLSSKENDLSSNNDEKSTTENHSESKNNQSAIKNGIFNFKDSVAHPEDDKVIQDSNQTDNKDYKGTLNITNLDKNSDRDSLEICQDNQATATDKNFDVNNDQHDIVSKTDDSNITTCIVKQTDAELNANIDKLDVDMKDQSTINENYSNTNEIDQVSPTDNITDTINDKSDENTTNSVQTENREIDNTSSKLDFEQNESKHLQSIDTNLKHSKDNNMNSSAIIPKLTEEKDTLNNVNDVSKQSVNEAHNIDHKTESISTKDSGTSDNVNTYNNGGIDRSNAIKDTNDDSSNTELKIYEKSTEKLSTNNKIIKNIFDKELKIVESAETEPMEVDEESVENAISNFEDSNKHNDNKPDVSNKIDKTNDSPTKNTNFSITSILNQDNSSENSKQTENANKSAKIDPEIDYPNDNIDTRNDENSNETENTGKAAEVDSEIDDPNDNIDSKNDNDRNDTRNDKSNSIDNSNAEEKSNDNFPDNISLNDATDDSSSTKENDRKNDDSLSLSSLKCMDDAIDIDKIDKFNLNDLSEDEKRLMAELDEQIGENNDKPDFDALSENYDFNV